MVPLELLTIDSVQAPMDIQADNGTLATPLPTVTANKTLTDLVEWRQFVTEQHSKEENYITPTPQTLITATSDLFDQYDEALTIYDPPPVKMLCERLIHLIETLPVNILHRSKDVAIHSLQECKTG